MCIRDRKRNINFVRDCYANLNDEKELYGVDIKTYNTHYYSIWKLNINNIFTIINHSLNSFFHLPKILFKKVIKYGNL